MALFTFVSFVLFVLFVLDSGFKYTGQMPGKTLSLMRMGRNPALPEASLRSETAAPVGWGGAAMVSSLGLLSLTYESFHYPLTPVTRHRFCIEGQWHIRCFQPGRSVAEKWKWERRGRWSVLTEDRKSSRNRTCSRKHRSGAGEMRERSCGIHGLAGRKRD